jgi:hypothetical protein
MHAKTRPNTVHTVQNTVRMILECTVLTVTALIIPWNNAKSLLKNTTTVFSKFFANYELEK